MCENVNANDVVVHVHIASSAFVSFARRLGLALSEFLTPDVQNIKSPWLG